MATNTPSRPLSVVLALGIAALVLSGCATDTPELVPVETPSVTPEPTTTTPPVGSKPVAADLVLTTEGLGELHLGEAPPTSNPSTDLVTYSPDACAGTGSPTADLWIANFPEVDEGFGPQAPFAIQVTGDVLTRVDVNSSEIITDQGLSLGSSLDAVLGTYPGGPDEVVNHADVSDVYVFLGTTGKLMFEVAVDRIPGYWDAAALNTVVHLSSISIDLPAYGVAATDNTIGICNVA